MYVLFAAFSDPLETVQNTFIDNLFREEAGSPNIAVVAIDDEALQGFGRLGEWPRTLHADAIASLHEAGAQVIVYDVLFADTSPDDEALASAIGQASNVVLASSGEGPSSEQSDDLYIYDRFTLPTDALRDAAAFVAHADVETQNDGSVRRVPLAAGDKEGGRYPAMALAAFYLQFGRPVETPPAGIDSLSLPGREVPLEERDTLRVNYAGHQREFTLIPFGDVVDGTFDPDQVAGKVVFVGATVQGLDRHPTPLGDTAGVAVHANALDTLLRARFLRVAPEWLGTLVAVAVAAFAAYAVPRWRIGYAAVFVILLFAAYELAVIAAFYSGHILNAVDPPAALMLAASGALVYRVVAERASRRETSDLFGRYVSGGVARELLRRADRGEIALGGELRDVTVLFGDIRGFTTISEGLDPNQLVERLNRRFEVIVESVLAHGGIVNKFVGDAIMAVWNAPDDQPEHALLACRAALRAQAGLEALADAGAAIHFGFGINTGTALAGNVGAVGRLEYTVMGENVNTASRLCGVAEGGQTWIGERTRQLIQEHMETEALPPQHLKGMSAPVVTYRLVRELTPAPERVPEAVPR
ncbi:MAG: adenylate/guanylate cyclase domain-containing protein [Dehalococcoidia bacterium]